MPGFAAVFALTCPPVRAAPAVQEPQNPTPWEGILEADHFAPMSMQPVNLPIYDSLATNIGYHDYQISLRDNYRPPVSEDSLYVNVWKPAGAREDLPVRVHVHNEQQLLHGYNSRESGPHGNSIYF